MELYVCGSNEAANLKSPPSCIRYNFKLPHPCTHNNNLKDPNGPPYCPNWLLRPTLIESANSIRILQAFSEATFLDVDGKLVIYGNNHPQLIRNAIAKHASHIRGIFKLAGKIELGIWLDDGFATLSHQRDASMKLVKGEWKGKVEVQHLAVTMEGHVACVFASAPRRVSHYSGWKHFLGSQWLGCEETEGQIQLSREVELASLELPVNVKQLVGGATCFMALLQSEGTEGGEVQMWTVSRHRTEPARVPTNPITTQDLDSMEIASSPPISPLLSSIPLPNPPSSPFLSPPTVLSIPPIASLAAYPNSPSILALSISTSQLLDLQHRRHHCRTCDPTSTNRPGAAEHPDIELKIYRYAFPGLGPRNTGPEMPTSSLDRSPVLPFAVQGMSVGNGHMVAWGAGRVIAKGKGWDGQLGIGESMFELEKKEFEDEGERSEAWLEMDLRGVGGGERGRREVVGVFAGDASSFVLTKLS